MQNYKIHPGTKPGPTDLRFKGRKVILFSENELKLNYNTMQGSNFVPWQYSGLPFLGKRTFVFVLRKQTKLSYSNTEFKHFPGGNTMDLCVRGEPERNVCFRSPKMYQNSPMAMLNSNIFPEINTADPVLWERKICFCSPKCTITLLQQCKIQQFSGDNTPDLRSGRGEFVFILRKCTENILQQCRIQKLSRGKYSRPPF